MGEAGGPTKVTWRRQKRFSLAARHRFFGQAPKKWGRKAGKANDHCPTYRRTRTNVKTRGNPRRGFPLGPPPALMRAQGGSALCGARPEALPLDSAAFEKAGETFIRASRSAQRLLDLRQMRWESAAFISSSRKSGWETLMSFSARSHVDAPARFTTPYSVAI